MHNDYWGFERPRAARANSGSVVDNGGASHDVITSGNAAVIHPSDFLFV